ncbi:anthrax toxin-like adenylyl cyclase domain-containing protein [Trinickia fusca]|uniref:anthrax toxin-like adenylyl cyclase domain-containing protein n=1 Tax=Trinickia fusca TaxID=2419777 RepID=UPI001600E32E|nr:anthrax toxin-like adenylyl cyclase domain-containing protein [Trinickia fusca]
MSAFAEYDATAGFPLQHIRVFQQVCREFKVVIASRELNPLCTDLLLEGYAAKGFHIKAKTCDERFPLAAGFVPLVPQFTKAQQNIEKQKSALRDAIENHGARKVALVISDQRFEKLKAKGLISVGQVKGGVIEIGAKSRLGAEEFQFSVTRHAKPGYWDVWYKSRVPVPSFGHDAASGSEAEKDGWKRLYVMGNPEKTGRSDYLDAVCGDYDLWGIFPHESTPDLGINNRPVPTRAVLRKDSKPHLVRRATEGQIIYREDDLADLAKKHEHPNLGNISVGVNKIRFSLNQLCRPGGGPVVMHSDYCGNPFGEIDFPLIFFIPALPSGSDVIITGDEYRVAKNVGDLRTSLREIKCKGFLVESYLNRKWSIPNYVAGNNRLSVG